MSSYGDTSAQDGVGPTGRNLRDLAVLAWIPIAPAELTDSSRRLHKTAVLAWKTLDEL